MKRVLMGMVMAAAVSVTAAAQVATMFPPVRGTREMVGAANNQQVEAGMRLLAAGGNAVDAGWRRAGGGGDGAVAIRAGRRDAVDREDGGAGTGGGERDRGGSATGDGGMVPEARGGGLGDGGAEAADSVAGGPVGGDAGGV